MMKYCSKCGKYYDDDGFQLIDCYSEYIDATLLEYEIVKCNICNTEYEVLLNDYEKIEE